MTVFTGTNQRALSCLCVVLAASAGLTGSTGCTKKSIAAGETVAVKAVSVSATQAMSRRIPVVLTETGNFVAEEASNVAPAAAGRVISTPVSVGAYVRAGQVVCVNWTTAMRI